MKYLEYRRVITEQLDRQFDEEGAAIEKAAEYCAASVCSGRLIHVFGCGHSQMFAMEVFYRAGGLVPVNALLIPHLALFPRAKLSTLQERIEGFSGSYLELLQTPTIILAIVALIGLIAQRKKFSEVLSGTVKTALGYLVLSAGSSLLVTEILPFVGLFQEVFNLSGFATGSEIIVGAMQDAVPVIASTSAIIMGAGFLVNILLARITPLKYIFLTGHMMWINSVAVAFCLYSAGMSSGAIIGIGIVLQGIILTLIPAIAQPVVRKITGSDDFAIGHLTTLGTVSSAYVGKLVGKGSKSAEDMKLPEGLKFFKDTSMSIAIVMFVFYMLVVILAGPESVGAYSGGTNYLIYGLLKALGFTAGVAGIMGNALGGRRGAMAAGFTYGLELIVFSGFTYKLFGHFASVGAEGTGHDCIDAMAVMTAMYKPVVGIIIIVAVFILACELEARRQKNLAAAGKK